MVAHVQLGNVFNRLHLHEEARECYKTAIAVGGDAVQLTSGMTFEDLHACRWDHLGEDLPELMRLMDDGAGYPQPFQLLAQPSTRRHDRARFEVFAYSYGVNDASPARRRIERAVDRFVDVREVSDRAAAEQVRSDGIDVLMDLKGYTLGARNGVLAFRPSPIQVNYLGYPGTLGAAFYDYIIGDPIVTPLEHAPDYSEKIAQMPVCYQPNDRSRAVGPRPTRSECGLPENGFVFCSFNSPLIWGEQLPQTRHLGRLQLADLVLDTRPVCAHTTASDALWAGVPVLTCPGDTFVSRVAASVLRAAGLPELIAADLAEYESIARELAHDHPRLDALKSRLTRNLGECPLFDSVRYTRDLEALLARMHERCLRGLAPDHLGALADYGR